MKRTLIALGLMLFVALPALAQSSVYVQGHLRSDGTYVPGYYRSAPNKTSIDNYSTKGNTNPYTGKEGSRDPYALSSPYSYRTPQPNTSLYSAPKPTTYKPYVNPYATPMSRTTPNPYTNPYLLPTPAPSWP